MQFAFMKGKEQTSTLALPVLAYRVPSLSTVVLAVVRYTSLRFISFFVFLLFFCSVTVFFHRDFTNRREIWHEVSPISRAGLLKFWGRYPQERRNSCPEHDSRSTLRSGRMAGCCFNCLGNSERFDDDDNDDDDETGHVRIYAGRACDVACVSDNPSPLIDNI